MDYEILVTAATAIVIGTIFIWGYTRAGIVGVVVALVVAVGYRHDEGIGFWLEVLGTLPVVAYGNWIVLKLIKTAFGEESTGHR